MAEFLAEQAKRLTAWEYNQADWEILDADPLRDEVREAANLMDTSPQEGFRRLLALADAGSAYSMNYVGWCYGVGMGVTKDPHQSQDWFRRAYEAGSERGLLEHGAHLVRIGQSPEAEKVYENGWERGLPAVYRLIRLRLKPTLPLDERLAWRPSLEWAAAAGHPAARYMLSKYLSRGSFGIRGIPRGIKLIFAHFAAILRDDEGRPITW